MVLGIAYRIFQMLGTGFVVDDDSSDRLSYRLTVGILVASAVLIGTKQLVGEPISCWIPAHFTGNHEDYTNSYCWIRNTYYLPWDENIPREHEDDKRYMITYYQWIPLILMLQALFFYLPRLFWVGLNRRVGIDVHLIMNNAQDLQNSQKYGDHEDILSNMSYHLHRMFKRTFPKSSMTVSLKSCLSRACCNIMGRKKGNYLLCVFLFHKLLYIANLLGQMFVLNHILGFKFNQYGYEVIRSLSQGEEWVETPFPRVTMCDMKIRRLGNVHRYAVQCVLPINLYTEKLYLFQWFWYVMLLTMAFVEFAQWVFRVVVWHKNREQYIKKQLFLAQTNFDDDDEMIIDHADEFCDEYLKQDGVFLLRLIAKNTTQSVSCLLSQSLWNQFKPWYEEKEAAKNPKTPKNPNPRAIDEPDGYPEKSGFADDTLPLATRRR